MKSFFTKVLFPKELLLYLISFLIAYLITFSLFYVLNSSYDSSLKDLLEKKELAVSQELRIVSAKYQLINDLSKWSDSPKTNNKEFETKYDALENTAKSSAINKDIQNLILYGNKNLTGFSAARKNTFMPYLESPSVSLNDVMGALTFTNLEKIFQKAGGENVKDRFSEDLGNLLDAVKGHKSGTYTNRRYLNGGIQFLTFIVAFAGMFILLTFFLFIWIEKQCLNESINSFELPENPTDNYSVGQMETTIKSLISQQKQSHSFFREMLINTISTFNWRGKEEAESTLNLEVQELRESMDSRFGMVKDFAWAVPSIGFIGTVVGIGNALGNAHNVIGQQQAYQTKGQIQLITGQLGIAFDTTLISLLLSILLVLLIHILTRKEEKLITLAVSKVKRDLLQKVAPLERANKLRRFNLLLEAMKSYTNPNELEASPFKELKDHLQDELNV